MRPKHLEEFLKVAIPNKWPVLIVGSPGLGKTDIVLKSCQDIGADVIISHPVVSDPTDYKGLPFVYNTDGGEKEAKFLPFSDLKRLIEATKLTVFFLDDLGQAPASVQAAAMQLLLGRRINDHKISDFVTFVAASNRREDKAGVQGILEPVKSRFMTIVDLSPDEEDWYDWALKNNMPTELVAFIRWKRSTNESMLYDFKPSMEMKNSPCPRTVAHAGRLINGKLPDAVEFEAIKGAAGEVFATNLIGFLKVYRNLPDPDKIIADPENSKLPDSSKRPEVMFALLASIAARATGKNFGNIVKLSYRLPDEFSVMLIKDCVMKDLELAEISAFREWSTKHKDLV